MNYKEILENILKNGTPKQPVRFDAQNNPVPVENGTIGTFCEIFRHDMSQGFPLTTLRKTPWRSIRVELEGFIKGITDKSWFQERNCKFWDEWANPVVVDKVLSDFEEYQIGICESNLGSEEEFHLPDIPTKKEVQAHEKDLGPIYGYQWRNFNKYYPIEDDGPKSYEDRRFHDWTINGMENGVDQFKSIIKKLKSNPYDRRMVCSAWNPNQEHLMALPPCHYSFTVVVYGNKLNLCWKQRSVDSSHGLPANIASYALLMLLLCEESKLEPGELVGVLEDCHLYKNTLEPVKELIKREEKDLPQVKIKRKPDGSFSIFDWTWEEVELLNYNPHPKLDMGKVTV
jgi:thymidylate synthase